MAVVSFSAAGVVAAPQSGQESADILDSLVLIPSGVFGDEPTVQDLLDSLLPGTVIDDHLPVEAFCAPPVQLVHVELVAEHSGLSAGNSFGFYPSLVPNDTVSVVPGSATPGFTALFFDGVADSVGYFLHRDPGSVWYTETVFNYDASVHFLAFATDDPHVYYLFWEDLGWLADADYNDMVLRITLPSATPAIIGDNSASALAAIPLPTVICEGDSLCFTVDASDGDCPGDSITITMIEGVGEFAPVTGIGSVVAEHCFVPPAEGNYQFIFRVTDFAGNLTEDTLLFSVQFAGPPIVSSTANNSFTICEPETLCVPFSVSSGAEITGLTVEPPAFIRIADSMVCMVGTASGDIHLALIAQDICGAADTFLVGWLINKPPPPEIACPAPLDTTLCGPASICLPVSATGDPQLTITAEPPAYFDVFNSVVCIDTDTAGVYGITVIAADSCGADTCTTWVNVSGGAFSGLNLGSDTAVALCSPDTVCVPYSINPGASVISIGDGVLDTIEQRVCFPADSAGVWTVTLVAQNDCGQDTVSVDVTVLFDEVPAIDLDNSYAITICEPETLCLGYTVTPGATIANLGPGFVDEANGQVCLYADQEMVYFLVLAAENTCGADTTFATINVYFDTPPQITLGPDTNVALCGPTTICRPFTTTAGAVVASIGDGYLDLGNGRVCVDADQSGDYVVTLVASSECGEDTASATISVDVTGPPTVDMVSDTTFVCCELCGPCVPFVATPGATVSLLTSTSAIVINEDTTAVCLWPALSGVHEIGVVATNACGADTAWLTVTMEYLVSPTRIELPGDTTIALCEPDTICLPYTVEAGATVISTGDGFLDETSQTVCVYATGADTFDLELQTISPCPGGTARSRLIISLGEAPSVSLGADTTVTQCGPDTVCVPYTVTGDLVTVSSLGDGELRVADGVVCVSGIGPHTIVLVAENTCGADTASQSVTLDPGGAPVLERVSPIIRYLCEPDSECIAFGVTDPDGDNVTLSVTGGVLLGDTAVCVYRPTNGFGCATVIATDDCGAADTAQYCVIFTYNQPPLIALPPDSAVEFCAPGTVCFDVDVVDPEEMYTVSVSPIGGYDAQPGRICFTADTTGSYHLTATVTDTCGMTASDDIIIDVHVNAPPTVTMPPDDAPFVCAVGGQMCVSGIAANDPEGALSEVVKTAGAGTFNAQTGEICFVPDTSGTYCFTIVATDDCGAADTGTVCRTVTINEAPAIVLENLDSAFYAQPAILCFAVDAGDPNAEQRFDVTKLVGAGSFAPTSAWDTASYQHCFLADTAGCYEFVFEVFDSCGVSHRDTSVVCVDIPPADSQITVCIDTVESINGRNAQVKIRSHEMLGIGGLDLLYCYDPTAIRLVVSEPDSGLTDWEYVTYRLNSDACGICNDGAFRIVGIADMNNGAAHPPASAFEPLGPLVNLTFFVTSDRSYIGQCIPIDICSFDCGDNTFSSPSGDTTYMAYDVDPQCLTGDATTPVAAIDFCRGMLCIVPPPDDRGDLNLNGIANEVGDAVLYSNYFIYGDGVWDSLFKENQIVASDVNDDGLVLTVGDLVYLILIITGDADPIPDPGRGARLVPLSAPVATPRLEMRREGDEMIVALECDDELGGLFVELTADDPSALARAQWLDELGAIRRRFGVDGNRLRILIYPFGKGEKLEAGSYELLSIPSAGNVNVTVHRAQAAGTLGQSLDIAIQQAAPAVVPTEYVLHQNVPNPFNARTRIAFALPQPGQWEIAIYNITGQLVTRLHGRAAAGEVIVEWDAEDETGRAVPTGVYFYRLTAGAFSDSRKMMLLK